MNEIQSYPAVRQNYPEAIESPTMKYRMTQEMPIASVSDYNHLVSISTPLITLITQIRHTVDHHNVSALRAQVVEEIKRFERKLSELDYPVRLIVAARYCLCTTIDEAVLSRPWGTRSSWVQGSLLMLFHQESWGGERFYIILEDMLRDVRKNIDFVELIYFLLSLGFEGKLYGPENRAAREEIRSRIFYHIRHARAKPERRLAPTALLEKLPYSIKEKKSKLKRVLIISFTLLVLLSMGFNFALYETAKPTLSKLDRISVDSPITAFSQVIRRQIIPKHTMTSEDSLYD